MTVTTTTPTTRRPSPPGRRRPRVSGRNVLGAMLSMPALALFALFAIYPGLRVFYLSLFDYSLTSPPEFVGLDNFTFLAGDPRFHEALLHSLVYTVGTYLPALALALVLAVALSRRMRGAGWVRLLYFLPVATSWVAISVVWRLVLHPDGLLNQTFGLDVDWLTSSAAATWALVIMGIWKETGFFLILYLAGLSRLPGEVYEAAQMDGAGAWQSFWRITFPLLKPITAICSVMGVIRGLQAFSPQVVLTDGAFGTEVVNLFVYKTAFENARMGRASAVAVFMFLVLIAVTMLQLRAFRREDG
ncbi:carbohydrate ABC transporter permease [Nonomuraea jiangxiensis]|uniref:Multiple sugar transport system permease protein/alpha-1,4-digalacturonate transport system permease protein/putative chitobiose transport system permease protein n=1 Tax=Nonomuraea jiangxiensis TaxID=633440 RepID=A0A1G9JUJ6_9ACTN|nr:sugar ABC transporter permease [Nonomuraea jiangxiensis]SDL40523.1 multiple sugar transport system permease protein/alpha-1,4-digalacturonate transport system permease protein/putative chitobiose transport system permease protein [Nonomuraea jiangxiensis]